MIISTVPASNCTPQTIVIGRRGTYDTMQITFDLSYLVENYGNGVAVLAVKRSQDNSAYPAVTSQEDDLLLWTISETDTYYVGSGECQLMWYVDGGLAKTIIYPIVVMRDILATSEEAPDAYQEWVDALIAEGAETLQNAQDAAQSASDADDAKTAAVNAQGAAEEAQRAAETAAGRAEDALEEFTTPTASATTLAPDEQATASYSSGHFTFGIPRGEKGEPGQKGDPGSKGDPGQKGDDGDTPEFSIGDVETLQPGQSATASITGTKKKPVLNLGIPKGNSGNDGTSPTITVTDIQGGHRVTITDVDHPQGQTIDVMNGTDGTDGDDGYSPVVTVTNITGGHRVTITDKTHPTGQSFDVMDGQDGASDAGEVTYDETATYPSGSVGAALTNQKNAISQLEDATTNRVLSDDVKTALLQIAAKVAYIDDQGSAYYTDLSNALYVVVSNMNEWHDRAPYVDLEVVKNQYARAADGAIVNYNGWNRTGYVPCHGASKIVFPPMPQSGSERALSNWFYDENKNPTGGGFQLSKTSSTTITVPSTAYYFIISSNAAALASCIAGKIVPKA